MKQVSLRFLVWRSCLRTRFVLLFAPGGFIHKNIFMNHFLLLRRTKRFWKTNLKSVCRPLMQVLQYGTINSRLHIIFIEIYFCLQEPFCPPRPSLPGQTVASSDYSRDLNVLFNVSVGEITGALASTST